MKRLLSFIAWFGSGAMLGQVAHTTLFGLWTLVGPLKPVNRAWYVLWLNAPDWLLAVVMGVFAGILIKRYLFTRLLLLGSAFAFAPPVIYWYLNSTPPTARSVAGDAVAVPLVVLSAMLTRGPSRPANSALEATAAAPRS